MGIANVMGLLLTNIVAPSYLGKIMATQEGFWVYANDQYIVIFGQEPPKPAEKLAHRFFSELSPPWTF